MPNNQRKCGIIYEKIAMRAGDNERIIISGDPKKGQIIYFVRFEKGTNGLKF